MATVADLLTDALGRVRDTAHGLLDDLPEEVLPEPPAPGANTVAWLLWHSARVLDEQVADAFDGDVVWTGQGWFERFGLPFPASAHGYGMGYDDVLRVRASTEHLRGYLDASVDAAMVHLRAVTEADLDRVVDDSWDPPVTLAVRLVSIIDDCTQHVGQASYAAGILTRR